MPVDLTNNDISTRYALQEDFNNGFVGRDRQVVIQTDDPKGYRPVIMDGATQGGKNKVALMDDLTDYVSNSTYNTDKETFATKTELSTKADSTALNNYLPLSGGIMTGDIAFNSTGSRFVAFTGGDYEGIDLRAGETITDGAWIGLYTKDSPASTGEFCITANNGTQEAKLIGRPNGEIVVPGSIVTAAGVGIRTASNNNKLLITSGTGWTHGAHLNLHGDEYTSEGNAGGFELKTTNAVHALQGRADGSLSWRGAFVWCWANLYNAGSITSGYATYPMLVNVMCTNGSPRITVNGVQIWGTDSYHGEYCTGVCFICPAGASWSLTGANVGHVVYTEFRC